MRATAFRAVSHRAFPSIAAGVIAADQASKWWVQRSLPLGISRPLLADVLKLTHVHNTGSAFSLFQGGSGWLILVSVIALVAITRYWLELQRRGEGISPVLLVGLALPWGGAAGNLIDRIRFGYVVDFLELPLWPVFNVADSAITLGALLLIFHFLRRDNSPGVQAFRRSGVQDDSRTPESALPTGAPVTPDRPTALTPGAKRLCTLSYSIWDRYRSIPTASC
jgi:signal peptidase II